MTRKGKPKLNNDACKRMKVGIRGTQNSTRALVRSAKFCFVLSGYSCITGFEYLQVGGSYKGAQRKSEGRPILL